MSSSARKALCAAGVAALGLVAACCILAVHHHQGVMLSGDGAVHLHGARVQRLDAEEAAVEGEPQVIDAGVPQAQLKDEERAEQVVAEEGIRKDQKTARKAQGEISALNGWMSSLDEKFEKYEEGNPYWDTSVTFNLENEDEDEDEEASDDAPADAKADDKGTSTGGQSSLATSDESPEDDVKDVKDVKHGKKKVKVPEEDAVVKFDRYLSKQWKKFLKKNHFSSDAEDATTGQSSQEGSDAGAQLRRRGLTRASLFGGLSGGRRGGTDRSNYKKRVDSEMAASDFME